MEYCKQVIVFKRTVIGEGRGKYPQNISGLQIE